MSVYYGVLRGKVDRWTREDHADTPHLQIRLLAGQAAWRIPVNVLSGDQSLLIAHIADPMSGHPILDNLASIPTGFTALDKRSERDATNALDFWRAPLFDISSGIELPPSGPNSNDDLQDIIATYLTQLKEHGGDLIAFGSKWPMPGEKPKPGKPIDTQFGTTHGMHDIHMNQGNPSKKEDPTIKREYTKDNGVFQDGGLILRFPSRTVGIFLRFQSQWLPTIDATGHRAPGAKAIPARGSPVPPPDGPGGGGGGAPPDWNDPAEPDVYIERALVNPAGPDQGLEVVVVGNASARPVNLAGWSLWDKEEKSEVIRALQLAPGESRSVVLSGEGAQLGNKGGVIVLKNGQGQQVHAVTYTKQDASVQGRYVRFNT